MNFFQKVRDDMGFWFLDRKSKKLPRQRTFNNLASASSVGILFEASKEDSYVTVISFAEDLVKRGLRVEMLGEVPNETFVNFICFTSSQFFGRLSNKFSAISLYKSFVIITILL